jgi:hypothetical protein
MAKDISNSQFAAACARRGFVRQGMGYYSMPDVPVQVNVYNAGKHRRDWLAYLIAEHAKALKKYAQEADSHSETH